MTATLKEVQQAVDKLPKAEQLALAGHICEQISRHTDGEQLQQRPTRAQRMAALAYCEEIAQQLPGEFDSAEDLRRIREGRCTA